MAQEINPFDAIAERRRRAREEEREPGTVTNPMTQAPADDDNPFMAIARRRKEEQRAQMIASQKLAAETTPDRRADAIKLASQTGLPADVVERNYDDVKTKWGGLPYQQIQLQTPSFSNWVAKPDNAALSSDDAPAMGNVEWVLKMPGRAFTQQLNHGRYAELAFKESLLGQTLTTEERDLKGSYKFNSELGGNLGVETWHGQAVTGAGRLLAQAIDPLKYGGVGGVMGLVIGGVGGGVIGSLAPGGGTAIGARLGAQAGWSIGARGGGAYGVLKNIGMQEAVGAYEEMVQMHDEAGQPIDKGAARMAALAVGAINGAIEAGTASWVLSKYPVLKDLKIAARRKLITEALKRPTVRTALSNLAKTYTGTLAGEVATETAQRAVSIALEEGQKVVEGGRVKVRDPGDITADLIDTAINSVPEFALGLGAGPAHQFTRDLHEAKRADQSVKFFSALGEGVAQAKTAQRHPEAFQELVKDAIKDNEGLKDVYVPTESWRVYWQGKEQDPGAMADHISGRTNALADAEMTGNLRIPMERYASQLAGTEHNAALLMEMRLGDPNAMNGRELEGFKAIVEVEQERIKQAHKDAALKEEDDEFVAQVHEQLMGAGVPRETARTSAKVMQGIANLERRAGRDPKDAFARLGITVERRELEEFKAENAPGSAMAQGGATGQEAGPGGRAPATAEGQAAAEERATEGEDVVEAVSNAATVQREQGEAPGIGTDEEIPGLAALEAGLQPGASMALVDEDSTTTLNASGESAASAEAMNRLKTMQRAGERFVVYDRAGRRRDLLGPDAVDYNARPGETFGVEGPGGFTLYTDNGGRMPAPGPRTDEGPALRNALRSAVHPQESALLPAVQAGTRIVGAHGPANAQGVSAFFVGYQPGYKNIMPTHAIYNIDGGEHDGSTVGVERLRELGIPVPPTPPLLTLYQQATAMNPRFKEWFGNSVVVDEEGAPLVVYHGTTHIFSSFSRERANPEGNFGAGFYFTNDPTDVGSHYSGLGPDLRGKIERRAEAIAYDLKELDPFLSDEEAQREAEQQAGAEELEQGGLTIPVFLKFENPAVLGGEHETRLSYDTTYNEEGDVVSESGTLLNFVQGLREVAADFYDGEVDDAIATILEAGIDGDLTVTKAVAILNADEKVQQFTNEDGDYVHGEVIRQALEKAGFDGIIDHTVAAKFGQMGLSEETTHYIAFHDTSIKSALGNSGNYEPLSNDILFQQDVPDAYAIDTMEPQRARFYTKLQRAVETAKQTKASGRDWKAIIKGAQIGVNRDEFAITRMEDLEEKRQYTKEEVLAHIKLNRPMLGVVILGDELEPGEEAAPGWDEDDLETRREEIMDRMRSDAYDNIDWDDYTGSAQVEEEEETDEEEVEEEQDTGEVDENGDPIYETVTVIKETTVTRYYAARHGGLTQRRTVHGGYQRTEWLRGTELHPDGDAYDNYDDAEQAAERWVSDLQDEDWIRERAYEAVDENIDYSQAEEEAREELNNEYGGGEEGGRSTTHYETYTLKPKPEEDSYREVFIRNTSPITKPEFVQDSQKDVEDAIATILFGDYYAASELTDEQKAEIAPRVAQAMEEQKKGVSYDVVLGKSLMEDYGGRALKDLDEEDREYLKSASRKLVRKGGSYEDVRQYVIDIGWEVGRAYESLDDTEKAEADADTKRIIEERKTQQYHWKDGHGAYSYIQNPIVRVRLSVRQTASGDRGALQAQVALQAELQGEIDQLLSAHPIISERTAEVQQEIENLRQEADYASQKATALRKEIDAAPPERMLFVEELQPPTKDSGEFAKMPELFQGTWRQIGWRWVIRHAVDHGFTRIAWTTGRQQVNLYPSIETIATKIRWTTEPDATLGYYDRPLDQARGEREVVITMKDGAQLNLIVSGRNSIVRRGSTGPDVKDFIKKPLESIIGKELTARVVGEGGVGELSGQKLVVGGKGLAQLYDKDYPAEILKIPSVKQGGVKKIEFVPMQSEAKYIVEEVPAAQADPTDAERAARMVGPDVVLRMTYQVRVGGEVLARFDSRDAAWDYQKRHQIEVRPQPSIPITPEMRELATAGDPLYQTSAFQPTTSAERDVLQATLDTAVAAATVDGNRGQVTAKITSTGEIHVTSLGVNTEGTPRGVGLKAIRAVLTFADQHNMQVSLDQGESTAQKTKLREVFKRLGFVQNGTADVNIPGAAGQWVRPVARDRAKVARLQTGPVPKGAYQRYGQGPGKGRAPGRVISLFETANLSTFLHEAGHYYLDLFGELVEEIHGLQAAGGTLTADQLRLLDDYAKILTHLGVTARDEIGVKEHELFARSFETYLFEGKAPDPELQETFGRIRAWFLDLYKSLVTLNAPLSDDIRQVFDRMLASDEAIAQAEELSRLKPMFLSADQAGVSPERFAIYRTAIEHASQSAREALDKELLAEVSRTRTREWAERKAEVREQVTREVHALPVYQAIAGIRFGTLPDGTPLADDGTLRPMRLSQQMIRENYGGDARVKSLPKQFTTNKPDEGWDPQAVAEMFGFSSGDQLLSDIANAVAMAKHIAAETERRMLHEHGSMLMDGTLHERAQFAVADEQREIVLREELRVLANLQRRDRAVAKDVKREEQKERAYERRWFEAEAKLKLAQQKQAADAEIEALEKEVRAAKQQARSMPARLRGAVPSFAAVRAQAKETIARTQLLNLKAEPYFAAARAASKAATEAAARQDFDAAVEAKQKEIINLAFAREVQRAKAEAEDLVDAVKKIAKPNSMAKIMIAGETYHDQIAGVLDRFEFARVSMKALARRAAIAAWVKGVESQGQTVTLPDIVLNEARRVNYQQLTVEELIGVADGIKHIAHLARFKNRLSKQQKTRSLNKLAAGLKASILSFKPTVKETERDRRSGGERKRKVMAVLAAHRKLASLLREMDGWQDGGPMISAIMFPLNAAADNAAVMQMEAAARWNALVEEAYPRGEKRSLYVKAFVPAIGQSMSKMERIMVAFNWANEGNRERLRNAEGWTDDQVQAILDTLDERDAKFIQGTLDFIGSYWESIAGQSMRLQGVRPEKVEAKAFRMGAVEIPGGYFPIKADDRRSAKATAMLDLESANMGKLAAMAHPMTKHGHDQARAETGSEPVRWDFGVISEHVTQVIHDLTHRETLIEVGKILGHKDVAQTIVSHYGDITFKTMKNTLRDIALGDTPAQNGFEAALNHTRTGSTIVGLGWSLTTVVAQLFGFATSTVRLRPRWMGRGLRAYLGTPQRMHATVEWVYEQSAFMRTRHLTQNREINEIRNKFGIYSGKMSGWVDDVLSTTTFDTVTRQGIADSYFYFTAKAQQQVDMPTWLGAYHKAMETMNLDPETAHVTAVAIADQAVIDTQSHGSMKDLAEVQRGTAALKLFTNFYSAWSALYNQSVEVTKKTDARNPFDLGRLMVDYLILFSFPAVGGYIVTNALTGNDDDKDKTWTEVLIREQLAYLMGTMVGVRELSGAVQGFYNYSGPAGSRIFATASRLIKQTSQLEPDEAFFKTLNETSGLLWHYPASRVWNGLRGLAALIEGKTQDPRALISGGPD